jgi:hypothetical protein
MMKKTAQKLGIIGCLVGIIFVGLFYFNLLNSSSTFQGCCGHDLLFALMSLVEFSAVCIIWGLISSLFALKNSKIPGISMFISSLFGILNISSFLVNESVFYSSISLRIIYISLLLIPFICISTASIMVILSNRHEKFSFLQLSGIALIFSASITCIVCLLQSIEFIGMHDSSRFLSFLLDDPNKITLVSHLIVVELIASIASLVGSILWFRGLKKAGCYTLIASSITGIVAAIVSATPFQNIPTINYILFILFAAVLIESIILLFKFKPLK